MQNYTVCKELKHLAWMDGIPECWKSVALRSSVSTAINSGRCTSRVATSKFFPGFKKVKNSMLLRNYKTVTLTCIWSIVPADSQNDFQSHLCTIFSGTWIVLWIMDTKRQVLIIMDFAKARQGYSRRVLYKLDYYGMSSCLSVCW